MHLVVFSHLRWSFVYQRPQHLLSRLAGQYPVIYVEEPQFDDREPRIESSCPCPGVEVLCPHTPVNAAGFHDDQLSVLQPLLAQALQERGIVDFTAWFYTPMALPLLSEMKPRVIVYDCMDELSGFKAAPRQLRQRESALMMRAGAVFTGGPSLYEAKKSYHPNVICLPSAVDAQHYARGRALADRDAVARAEELQRSIAGPRLGFFGVLDERLDLQLVADLADANLGWQIVMVGPVVKIDPATLPRRANIHWLGQQDYAVLPQLVANWSVCLMPFGINESTRFISPTKTLEYMAAGKPVVSTRIHDVVQMFGEVVEIADDSPGFIKACRRVLSDSELRVARREREMASAVQLYSWDRTAAEVSSALEGLLYRTLPRPTSVLFGAPPDLRTKTEAAVSARVRAS